MPWQLQILWFFWCTRGILKLTRSPCDLWHFFPHRWLFFVGGLFMFHQLHSRFASKSRQEVDDRGCQRAYYVSGWCLVMSSSWKEGSPALQNRAMSRNWFQGLSSGLLMKTLLWSQNMHISGELCFFWDSDRSIHYQETKSWVLGTPSLLKK